MRKEIDEFFPIPKIEQEYESIGMPKVGVEYITIGEFNRLKKRVEELEQDLNLFKNNLRRKK